MTHSNDLNYDLGNEHIEKEEVPPSIDPSRPPQRNEANGCGSCACGCACGCARSGVTDGGGIQMMQVTQADPVIQNATASRTSSEVGDEVNDGDEGAEDHLIEVGDLGYVSLSLIHRALAKHARCTCHPGILPSPDDYPFSAYGSPVISGMASPGDSVIVEVGSRDISMASSGIVRSWGSPIFEHMNAGPDPDALMQAFPLLFQPLRLTAELPYPLELSISSLSSLSERDYSVPVEEFAEYDMW